MQRSPFNPLDPHNIQAAPTSTDKRHKRFYHHYPWYFATIWAVVVSGFLWAEVLHPDPPLPPIPPCIPEGSHRYVTPPGKVRPLIEVNDSPEHFTQQTLPPPPPMTGCDKVIMPPPSSKTPSEDTSLPLIDPEYDWEEMPDEIEIIVEEEEPVPSCIFICEPEPKPLNYNEVRKAIGYPKIARDARIQGTVIIRFLVNEQGGFDEFQIIKSDHPILIKAVEKHIHLLRFEPAWQGGKPIPFWVNVPIRFRACFNAN